MSEIFDPRSSSEHLLEHNDRNPAKALPSTAPPVRRRSCPRVGPPSGKSIAISLALIAVFAILDILLRWRIFGGPERRSPSDELSHRSACSTYPEECQKTAPFVFDSIYSLLKQWPSNYAPNGHSVVPATVAPNTLLYRAQMGHEEPKNPVFFAFDAEMSLGIYGSTGTPKLRTMTTTKELRVIYLDGHSATLTSTGTLDSQIAILRNHIPADPSEELIYDEHQRAVELCQLASQLNIDGIVRMNAGFEILVCDYHKSGVRELFVTNITVPVKESREDDPSLPRDPHRQPPLGYGNDFAEQNGWEWVRSSTWHYGSEAVGGISESRVRLDICGLVSWYDPSLQSLNGSHRAGIRSNDTYENGWGLRRGHRLLEATANDIATFRGWLSAATSGEKTSKCSHTDWQALIETIVNKYRNRAREILFNLEKNSSDAKAVHQIINNVYTLTHAILYPYLEYPVIGGVAKSEATAKTLASCSAAYTGHIQLDSLSEFEVLIKESTYIVVNELCQWAWDLFEWTDGRMHNRLQQTAQASTISSQGDTHTIQKEIVQHKSKTQSLLQWTGWDVLQSCENKCRPDELCYIPMWPVIYSPGKRQGGIYGGSILTEEETVEFWTPKCLSRQDWDCGGSRAREPQYQFPDVPYEKCISMQSAS